MPPAARKPENGEEDKSDEEEQEAMLVCLAAVLGGAVTSRLSERKRKSARRYYLIRKDLQPNPRSGTAWQALYQGRRDAAFITTMGFDVATFDYLLAAFAPKWDDWTITREDVNRTGAPRPGARSLDAAGALGLVLHYLASAMTEQSLQLIFALTPSTLNRYLGRAQMILDEVLDTLPECKIRFPKKLEDYERLRDLIVERHPVLDGAFASIDGLSLPAQEAGDPETENASYNAWKSGHRINNVILFSPEGVIIGCVLNAPGSWHDTRVARSIFEALQSYVPAGFYVVADSGFPKGTGDVADRLVGPMKSGERLPADPVERSIAIEFNRQLLSYRQTAEWGMRALQGSFARLRVPLQMQDSKKREIFLSTCMRLSNLRTRRVGINQIRSVYMPTWRASEDERLWDSLSDMIFADVRTRDRVSKFHLVEVREGDDE